MRYKIVEYTQADESSYFVVYYKVGWFWKLLKGYSLVRFGEDSISGFYTKSSAELAIDEHNSQQMKSICVKVKETEVIK